MGKPKDQHNGLAVLEADFMKNPDHSVTAIVTYKVSKLVEDRKKNDNYPVVYVEHIEPITTPEALASVLALQQAAYQSRTGENELNLDFDSDDEGNDDDIEAGE
jgi:hypothetical protein